MLNVWLTLYCLNIVMLINFMLGINKTFEMDINEILKKIDHWSSFNNSKSDYEK